MAVTGYSAPITQPLGSPGWNPYGMTPNTPATTFPTNLPTDTSAGNISDLPNLETLTKAINDLNIAAQKQANMSRIPGEAGLEQQSSDLIGAQMRGEVPADVRNLLQQQGAESNVRAGRDSNTAYLRALGLTSLGQEQAGQENLTRAVARNPVAPLFDPTTQLLTPYQAGNLGLGQGQLALEWYRAMNPAGRFGGAPSGGNFGGTGGTAMGPTRLAGSSGMGNLLFPGTTQPSEADLAYGDQPYQDWLSSLFANPDMATLDQLYGGSLGGGSDTPPTFDQLNPTFGGDQGAATILPETMYGGDLTDLYGG